MKKTLFLIIATSLSITLQAQSETTERNIEMAEAFMDSANEYFENEEYDKALELYQKALSIQRPLLGENDIEVGFTYAMIAHVRL